MSTNDEPQCPKCRGRGVLGKDVCRRCGGCGLDLTLESPDDVRPHLADGPSTDSINATYNAAWHAAPDLRPRCQICGRRWLPEEGVDAQTTPCPQCASAGSRASKGAGIMIDARNRPSQVELSAAYDELTSEGSNVVIERALLRRAERLLAKVEQELADVGDELGRWQEAADPDDAPVPTVDEATVERIATKIRGTSGWRDLEGFVALCVHDAWPVDGIALAALHAAAHSPEILAAIQRVAAEVKRG